MSDLEQMQVLVAGGMTVRQAAKQVYGRIANYYSQTTEVERSTVYSRPEPVEGLTAVWFQTPANRKKRIRAAARAEGKTVSQFVSGAVNDYLVRYEERAAS